MCRGRRFPAWPVGGSRVITGGSGGRVAGGENTRAAGCGSVASRRWGVGRRRGSGEKRPEGARMEGVEEAGGRAGVGWAETTSRRTTKRAESEGGRWLCWRAGCHKLAFVDPREEPGNGWWWMEPVGRQGSSRKRSLEARYRRAGGEGARGRGSSLPRRRGPRRNGHPGRQLLLESRVPPAGRARCYLEASAPENSTPCVGRCRSSGWACVPSSPRPGLL